MSESVPVQETLRQSAHETNQGTVVSEQASDTSAVVDVARD